MIISKKKLERMIREEKEKAAREVIEERDQDYCRDRERENLRNALNDIDRRLLELEKRKESNEACGVSMARYQVW